MNRFVLLAVLAVGCTDASRSKVFALGSAEVTCYSGGQVIYKGKSTGRVQSEEQSDGWYFQEEGTGAFIRISGTCIVKNP